MAIQYMRLQDIPAPNLAEGLILRIYYDTMQAEAMNPDGSLKVELIPPEKIQAIAYKLIDDAIALANSKFKEDGLGGEDQDPT